MSLILAGEIGPFVPVVALVGRARKWGGHQPKGGSRNRPVQGMTANRGKWVQGGGMRPTHMFTVQLTFLRRLERRGLLSL